LKKTAKNFLALFISEVFAHLLGFFATVYIARILGVDGFGCISYALAFLTYGFLFTNPGLTTIGAREIAKNPNNPKITDEIVGLRLLLATLLFLFSAVAILIIPGEHLIKKIIILYFLSLFPFAFILEFVFQGQEKMEYIGIARIIQYTTYLIFLYLLLKTRTDILKVPLSFLLGYASSALFFLGAYWKIYRSLKPRLFFPRWQKVVTSAIPVGLATIFNQIALNLPLIILGVFHPKSEVGLFSAGFKIVVLLLIIERISYYLIFPITSRQFIHTPERLAKTFDIITHLLFTITIPISLGGVILAPKLVNFVYGPGYEGAILPLRILLLYFLVAPINTIFGYGLVSIDQQRRFFRVILYTAIINLILIIILGINFKSPGTATALFISELVGILLMNRELKKFIKFETMKNLPKPILASIFMGIVLAGVNSWNIIIQVILGIFGYVIILYLIKGFIGKDLKNLKPMEKD